LRLIVSGLLRLGLIGRTLLRTTPTRCPNNAGDKQHEKDHYCPFDVAVFCVSAVRG
jgi:hypothetical protein